MCHVVSDVVGSISTRENWLSGISGDTLVSEINVPGTHDTAAIDASGSNPYACQHHSVTQQLNGGIRLMDVRLKVKRNNGTYGFVTYHGNIGGVFGLNEFQTLPLFMEECCSFLEGHAREFLIMSIKIDDWNGFSGDADGVVKTLCQLLERYPVVSGMAGMPTLDMVRGNILLFNRINDDLKIGMPMQWDENTSGSWAYEYDGRDYAIYVQDKYKDLSDRDAAAEKLGLVVSAFEEKGRAGHADVVWNFASATWYGLFGVYIMPGLLAEFGERDARNRWQKFGWTLFDHPFTKYETDKYGCLDIVQMIIASNDGYQDFPDAFSLTGRENP